MELKNLFSPEKIGSIKVKNRFVRSATYTRKAEKYGQVGEKYRNYYSELAKGGIGLIITGWFSVDKSGITSIDQPALFDDSFIPGHQKLVKAIHDNDSKILAQIGHPGRQGTNPKHPPKAPSPIINKITGLTPKEMTTEEIHHCIENFAKTGARAFECEYDGIQLHAAHGYLLSNFLSPYTNRRQDEFGGSVENRVKIIVDIYNTLQDKVSKSFPIIIKLQTQDFISNGLELSEGKEFAKIIVDAGFDAIEPSGGMAETQLENKNPYPSRLIKEKEDQNFFLPTALELKPIMKDTKLILMGGIRDPISASQLIKDGTADFISMSRPFIYEPHLINRWKEGDLSPAKCNSCNACYMTLYKGEVYCAVREKLERRKKREKKE